MLDALQFEFMRNALLAGIAAGIICGMMGTLVVVNRIVFLSGGIAHAAYGGIGLSFFMGWPYLPGTIGFTSACALVMAVTTIKAKHRADTIVGVIWAVGMAIGIILLDLTPGYHADLMSFLFGSILAVRALDLWLMIAVGACILLITGLFYKDLLAMSYDEEFAMVRGVPVHFLYMVLILILALSVVIIIQVIGLILVIALLTIAPFIAEKYVGSMLSMMLWSSLLNIVFIFFGLWLAYGFNLTSGAAIILVAGLAFFTDVIFHAVLKRKKNIVQPLPRKK